MVLTALILALLALFCCVYLWLESQKKLSKEDIAPALCHASEELSKTYAKSVRDIETEWADMYQKFSRLAGRMDKTRAIETPQNPAPEVPRQGTRSDLIRQHRNGRIAS
jgi:hypothetical protein